MNAVIDRREFDKMDEFQSLLRAIDEVNKNWGFTSNSYVKATNKQTESPTNDQLRFRWL